VQEDLADYTAFHCAICQKEIDGGYLEQIDDRRWGIVPETSDGYAIARRRVED